MTATSGRDCVDMLLVRENQENVFGLRFATAVPGQNASFGQSCRCAAAELYEIPPVYKTTV